MELEIISEKAGSEKQRETISKENKFSKLSKILLVGLVPLFLTGCFETYQYRRQYRGPIRVYHVPSRPTTYFNYSPRRPIPPSGHFGGHRNFRGGHGRRRYR